MEEKILEVLRKISLSRFGINNNLADSKAIQGIAQKGESVIFAIDVDVLKINHKQGEELIKLCQERIKNEIGFDRVIIALTANKAAPQDQQKSEITPVIGVKKIIAVASAKGGVGKSTIACNLAVSLKKMGKTVALVDADIYGPSIPHLMNLSGKPEMEDGLLLPMMAHGVKCISIGSLVDEKSAGVWRGPMVTKILYQLIRSVNWQSDGKEVDVMVIDMPPGTGDVYLSVAEKFPIAGVVIVSTPQSLSVIDVVKSIDCFEKLKIPVLGLVQNMSYLEVGGEKKYIFGKDGAKNLAEKSGIRFLGEVPIMQEIADSTESRVPIAEANSDSESAVIFRGVAELL